MKTIYVLDTNALLYNPQLIFSLPQAEVIIPQAVLIELDRLKLASVDPAVKFKGREVSRVLYELSEKGKLLDGIELEDKTKVKIVTAEPNQELPPFLGLKSTDDQILAVAYQVTKANPKDEVILISNDLNMLLKAQALDIEVQRYEEKTSQPGFNGISRLFRIRQPALFWLAIVLIGVILVIFLYTAGPLKPGTSQLDIPPELKAEIEAYENQKAEYERVLKNHPDDLEALVGLGNLYFDAKKYQSAVELYKRALRLEPKNANVRTDMAISYFNLKLTDAAIREVKQVIKDHPEHAYAHYNLGVFLWFGKADHQGALAAFQKYLELEPEGTLSERAKASIQQLELEIQAGAKKP